MAALYLLTCKGRNTEGLFRFRLDHAALDLRWDAGRLAGAIGALEGREWAFLEDGWMLLAKSLRWEPPKGQKQCGGAASKVDSVPRSSGVYRRFFAAAEAHAPDLAAKLDTPSVGYLGTVDTVSGDQEGVSASYSSPTPTPTPTPTPPPLRAAVIAPDEVRSMLVTAGFAQMEVDEADAAIRNALGDLNLPADVDWWRFGQEIQKAREVGRLRHTNPGSAIRFIARGASGPPRQGKVGGRPRSPVDHYAAMADPEGGSA